MSPLIVLILLSYITCIANVLAAIGPPIIQKDEKKEEAAEVKKQDAEITINLADKKPETDTPNEAPAVPVKKPPTIQLPPPKNNSVSANSTVREHKKFKPTEVMESGALIRGVLVVVALSILIIIYMAVKTYCGKSNKSAMVRKYGVRTRRSDIEMTPLPLDEDEEDETLFEVGNANR